MLQARSRRWARRAALLAGALAAALLLSDCATHPSVVSVPPPQSWAQRQPLLLAAANHFTLSGRLAASHANQGISAGVHWQQQGADAQLSLSGPLGFGGARVSISAESISIRTNDGRELAGDAAVRELTRLLGFEPPLQSLRFWVLGVPDPTGGPATPMLDDQQRLSHLSQDGWSIAYEVYVPVLRQWLPRRLSITREDLRLRLVIDDWQL
ncbi:MAG TPA: lipoprotein insertase outer membrane protein LolB [Steroidobacteraceae bacterium]|jgi:outer membrane lipoprotein LolB|nr:lipoprotein insertase outer membrane protein LolB [Steroidobacteraceae bacterium]